MVPEELAKLDKDYKPTRAERRRKPLKPRYNIVDYVVVPSNILTKASHKYKKLRSKNVTESNKERSFKAREANKTSDPQVS